MLGGVVLPGKPGNATREEREIAIDYSSSLGRPVQPGEALMEEPCVPRFVLPVIEETTGRPCPRVELHPANGLAADLSSLLLQPPQNQALLTRLFDAACAGMDPEEQVTLIHRVYGAVQHPRIVRLTQPKTNAKKPEGSQK
jgi:hypothetical protein